MVRSKKDKFKVQVWANYILIKHGGNSGNAIDKLIYNVKHFSKFNKRHKHSPGLFNGYLRGEHYPRENIVQRFETDFGGKYRGAKFWLKNPFWKFLSENLSKNDLISTYQLLSPETTNIKAILNSFYETQEHKINSVNEAFDVLAKLFAILQALNIEDKKTSSENVLSLRALMSTYDLYCMTSMFQPLLSIENKLDSYIASMLFDTPVATFDIHHNKKKLHYKMLDIFQTIRKKETSDNEKIHFLSVYQNYIDLIEFPKIFELYKNNEIRELKSFSKIPVLLRHMRDWRRNNKHLI